MIIATNNLWLWWGQTLRPTCNSNLTTEIKEREIQMVNIQTLKERVLDLEATKTHFKLQVAKLLATKTLWKGLKVMIQQLGHNCMILKCQAVRIALAQNKAISLPLKAQEGANSLIRPTTKWSNEASSNQVISSMNKTKVLLIFHLRSHNDRWAIKIACQDRQYCLCQPSIVKLTISIISSKCWTKFNLKR